MSHVKTGERTWIDELADRFERDWKGGLYPRIEDLLDDVAGSRRLGLLEELLRVERELRVEAGESPSAGDYRVRFPNDLPAIDAVFGVKNSALVPAVETSRSLLFGLLALQNNFVDREALLAAFNAWVAHKSQSIGQILRDRGVLSPARYQLLEGLVQEHLDKYGGDPERSLAVISVIASVRNSLEEVPDLDLQSSLLYVRLANADTVEEADSTASWEATDAPTDAEGRFRIVRFHDRGALGEVYVARDQQLHRIVALKRIKADKAASSDNRARFIVEAEVTGRLEHPGIVPVYGLGTYSDGRPFYAMRFIRGDNLKSAIDQFHKDEATDRDPGARTLALLKLLRRFLDVCNAIDYAHSRGVLHRDLKPGNIMLGKFGETMVVDWGLAKAVGRPDDSPDPMASHDERTLVPESGSDLRGTEVGSRLGTPAFMSPEQAAGRINELGPARDVYSLGATLFCLLTGKAPFDGPDLGELLRKVERGDFPPPRQIQGWVDPALEAVCLKAMANDPSKRYPTPRALADDIEHWLADEPVSAWREPIRRRARRWAKRHRMLVTGLGASLVALVAALAVGNFFVAQQRDRAEQNLAFARTVVDEMYTGVAEELGTYDGASPEQRVILERALRFYQRIAVPQSRDPLVLYEAAQAGIRLGKIQHWFVQEQQASASLTEARAILSQLSDDYPSNLDYRESLARCLLERGRSFAHGSREDEATEDFLLSAEISAKLTKEPTFRARSYLTLANIFSQYLSCEFFRNTAKPLANRMRTLMEREFPGLERWAKEYPDDLDFRERLDALVYYRWRLRFTNRGDFQAVESGLLRRLDRAEKLVREKPGAALARFHLAQCLRTLTVFHNARGDYQQALKLIGRSSSILQALIREHPDASLYTSNLAVDCHCQGYTLLLQGNSSEAHKWHEQAINLLRSASRQGPLDAHTIHSYTALLSNEAENLNSQGRYREALPLLEEAIALKVPQEREFLEVLFCVTAARVGQLEPLQLREKSVRATLLDRTGIEHNSKGWVTRFDSACIHASFSKIYGSDQTPGADGKRKAQVERQQALDDLEKSVATGEFKEMLNVDYLRRDPTLDILRSDPRFQRLLMDLSFPDNPFRN